MLLRNRDAWSTSDMGHFRPRPSDRSLDARPLCRESGPTRGKTVTPVATGPMWRCQDPVPRRRGHRRDGKKRSVMPLDDCAGPPHPGRGRASPALLIRAAGQPSRYTPPFIAGLRTMANEDRLFRPLQQPQWDVTLSSQPGHETARAATVPSLFGPQSNTLAQGVLAMPTVEFVHLFDCSSCRCVMRQTCA
jgi:hypothetical protein